MSRAALLICLLALATGSLDAQNAAPDKNAQLMEAVKQGDAVTVRTLVAKSARVNYQDGTGTTPLMLAAQRGDIQVIKVLLDGGASLNLTQKDGWNALLLACREGHGDVVEALLAKQADYGVRVGGRKAIHYAAEGGCNRCLNALLLAGADPNERSKDNWTPLLLAAAAGQARSVTVLLANRANAKDRREGFTPLMLAAQKGRRDAVKALIAGGVQVNDKRDGATALKLAEAAGYSEIAKVIQAAGGKP